MDFNFKRYYVGDQREDDLYQSANPFALVILTALIGLKKGLVDKELLELKFSLVKRLMQIKLPRQKIHRLLGFINSYLDFEKKETNIKFVKRIELVTTKNNNSMGILEFLAEEAKKEGEREALISTARKMLKEKASISFVHRCTGLPKTQITKLIKRA